MVVICAINEEQIKSNAAAEVVNSGGRVGFACYTILSLTFLSAVCLLRSNSVIYCNNDNKDPVTTVESTGFALYVQYKIHA